MTEDARYRAELSRLYGLADGGMRMGLVAMEKALSLLGRPDAGLSCVQIAGTNGKGTTSAAIAHGARACGLRVGLYTSPHLHRFSERIRVDGLEVEPDLLSKALRTVLDLREKAALPLTFFEVATVAAILVFAERGLDLCVLEAGLGGRLDATSAIAKRVSAITTIGLDHTDILGDTIPKVAAEKAAIARPGVPLVVGHLPVEALDIVRTVAAERGAPLHILGEDFDVPNELPAPLPGEHMRHNLSVAAKVLQLLSPLDGRLVLETALPSLASLHWPGRLEHLSGEPSFLLDGAHNLEGIRALVSTLEQRSSRPDCALFGAVMGKPAPQMLSLLRTVVPRIVLAPPPLPRAIDCTELAGPADIVMPDIEKGLFAVRNLCGAKGLILVTGSLFTVGEARRILLNEPADPPIRL